MSRPVDVDTIVSGFLSELNTLYDSLGLIPDTAAADLPALKEQQNLAGYTRITPTDAESPPATQGDFGTENAKDSGSISPRTSKDMPCRNIDVLLMNDNRFIAGMRRDPEEFGLTSNDIQGARFPAIPYHGQPRLAGWALIGSRCSLCWAPFTAWIRKARGPRAKLQANKDTPK